MAAKAEQSEVVKRALAMLHSRPEPSPIRPSEGRTAEAPEVQEATPELLAASLLAENEPDEAGSILAIWEDVFGMTLDREQVAKHLERLRQWQSRWVMNRLYARRRQPRENP